jgi:cytochrome c2
MRRLLAWGVGLVLVAAVVAGTFLWGYFSHAREWAPFHRLITRIERKIDRSRGGPTETERKVALLETTFLQLRGEVWPQPDNDFVNGGALAVWGEDLLVMNRLGRVMRFEPGAGLQPTAIRPPESGRDAYVAASQTEAYKGYLHQPDKFRFNDLKVIEAPGLRGLAISYTHYDAAQECYGTRVSWLDLPEGADPATLEVAPDAWRTIFDSTPCQKPNPGWVAIDGIQAGGRMVFLPPSTLYLAHGDYSLDGIHTYDGGIQDDASTYGKVIAIDLAAGGWRVYAKGLRNPQGITLDPEGRLWTVEHAERGGDELNLIEEGGNYGWPRQSLGTLYSGQPLPTEGTYGRHDLYTQPVFAWLPSTAPSTLITIRGIDPSWDGDLLAGSLSNADFGQSLWHIRLDGPRVVFAERIRVGERIRSLAQWGDRIAAWLDTNELVIFTPARRPDPLAETLAALATERDAQTVAAVKEVLEGCNQCHSYAENVQMTGPSLNGVVGRKVASAPFAGYSEALAAKGGVWDRERLAAFLSDPAGFAPGTSMPDPGLAGQDALLDAVIRALELTDGAAREDLRYN